MKRAFLIGCVLLGSGWSMAQQLPQYTQYFLNDFVINPAVAGSKGAWIGQSNNRFQWVGIQDAPRTYVLSLHGPLNNEKMGLGAYLFTDITGPTRRTGFSASYAYHIRLTDDIKLGMGLTFGALQFQIDGSKITTQQTGDVAISNGNQSVVVPDAGAGLYAYSDKFFAGFSAPQLIGNEIQFFDDYDSPESRLSRHFFLMGGYNFQVMDDIVIQPSTFIKYVDPLPVQFDVTLRGIYKEIVWAGVSYRMDDAVGFMLGYTFQENLTFGYSYDVATSEIQNHTTGSHELMLGIRFRNRGKIKSRVTEE